MTVPHPGEAAHTKGLPIVATLGALGVVDCDIGTSPLYALKEAAKAAAHGGPLIPEAILGVVSLILWALILIISVKYALLICAPTTAAKAGSLRCWHCFTPATPSRERGVRSFWSSAWSARRCSMATAPSRRPSPCSARLKA